jgi:hypothetical protein
VDSHELIGRSGGNRWIPLVAVVQDDFRQIIRHWAYWIWAGLAILLPILWLLNVSSITAGSVVGMLRQMGATHEVAKPNGTDADSSSRLAADDDAVQSHLVRKPQGERYTPMSEDYEAKRRAAEAAQRPYQEDDRRYSSPTQPSTPTALGSASQLGGKLLGMHILIWIALAMALGASAISSEAVSVGESVMCWGVSRWQYFIGKIAARSFAAMTLIVVLSLPTLLVFNSKAGGDLAFWASIKTTLEVAGIVGCVVAAGVAAGAWFRTSMRAVAVSVVALFFFGVICTFLAPVSYSPMAYVSNLPYALRGTETALESSALSLAAWTAGGLGIVSMGKFMWADL